MIFALARDAGFWLVFAGLALVAWAVLSARGINARRDKGRPDLHEAEAARQLYPELRDRVERVPQGARRSRSHVTGDRP